jgi:hypothetical protein
VLQTNVLPLSDATPLELSNCACATEIEKQKILKKSTKDC